MGERPSHAQTVRAAVVEAPLWLFWRLAYGLDRAWNGTRGQVGSAARSYRESSTVQRRLVLLSAAQTVLLLGLAVLAVWLLV